MSEKFSVKCTNVAFYGGKKSKCILKDSSAYYGGNVFASQRHLSYLLQKINLITNLRDTFAEATISHSHHYNYHVLVFGLWLLCFSFDSFPHNYNIIFFLWGSCCFPHYTKSVCIATFVFNHMCKSSWELSRLDVINILINSTKN